MVFTEAMQCFRCTNSIDNKTIVKHKVIVFYVTTAFFETMHSISGLTRQSKIETNIVSLPGKVRYRQIEIFRVLKTHNFAAKNLKAQATFVMTLSTKICLIALSLADDMHLASGHSMPMTKSTTTSYTHSSTFQETPTPPRSQLNHINSWIQWTFMHLTPKSINNLVIIAVQASTGYY